MSTTESPATERGTTSAILCCTPNYRAEIEHLLEPNLLNTTEIPFNALQETNLGAYLLIFTLG